MTGVSEQHLITGYITDRDSRSKEVFLHEDLEKNSCTYDCACSLSCSDALMVGASEHGVAPCALHDVTCDSCGSTNITYVSCDTVLYSAQYKTPIYCYYEEYLVGRVICLACDAVTPDFYVNSSQHPTLLHGKCPACGYIVP